MKDKILTLLIISLFTSLSFADNENFDGQDVSGQNFSNKSLINSSWIGATADSDFDEANLTSANFTNANLTNVKFSSVTLTSANFRNADLRGANMKSTRGVYTTKNTIMANGKIQSFSMASSADNFSIRKYTPATEGGVTISAKFAENTSVSGDELLPSNKARRSKLSIPPFFLSARNRRLQFIRILTELPLPLSATMQALLLKTALLFP